MIRRRLWAPLAAVGMAVLLFPAAAHAHAVLEETDPADGAVLDSAPSVVTLRFSEVVSAPETGVNVLGPDGNPVDIGDVRAIDTTVRIPLPEELPDGTYVVSWRVISADAHPISGAFVFSIGAPSSGTTSSDTPSSDTMAIPPPGNDDGATWQAVRAAVNFAAYLGVLLAAGMTIFVVFLHDSGPERRRLLRLARGAAALGALGLAASIPVHVMEYVGNGLSGLGDADAWNAVAAGSVGAAALVTALGLIALVGAGRRPDRDVVTKVVAAVAALIALGGFAISGHTRAFGPWWLVVPSDIAHLAAGSIWFGGLVGLGITLYARRRNTDSAEVPRSVATAASTAEPTAVSTAQIIARFSSLAAVSLVAVAAFGVVLAWRILGSWGALFNSGYGIVLLVKTGLVAVAAAIGGYNRFRLVPRTSDAEPGAAQARLGNVVRVEAAVLVAVLAATGVLVDRSPTVAAAGNDADAASDTVTSSPTEAPADEQSVVVGLGDITGRIVVDPARAGTNEVTVTLSDESGERLDALAPPTLELSLPSRNVGPIGATTTRTGPGTYEASVDLPVPGRWEVRLTARLSEFSKPIGVAHLQVRP